MQINLQKLQSLNKQVEFCKKDVTFKSILAPSVPQRISLTTLKPPTNNMEPRRSIKTTRSQWTSAPTPKQQSNLENNQNYFFSNVKRNLGNSQIKGLLNQIHQMITLIEPAQLCKCISLKENNCIDIIPKKVEKTLALDLDETLVHSEPYRKGVNYDHVIRQGLITIGLFVRPYCNYFLEEASKEFELILYTASSQIYADMIVKYIDPKGKYFSAKFYKQHCVTLRNGIQVKNLQILGNRDLKKVILVDNGPINFQPQPFNGIPIVPYINEKQDKELLELLVFLKDSIVPSLNVQITIKNYFQYQLYRSFQDGMQAFQVLYVMK